MSAFYLPYKIGVEPSRRFHETNLRNDLDAERVHAFVGRIGDHSVPVGYALVFVQLARQLPA